MSTARIKRTYAEWLEDVIEISIPDGATVTDEDLIANFDALYGGAFQSRAENESEPWDVPIDTEAGTVHLSVTMGWEDENRQAVDGIDDVLEVKRHG